MCLAGPIHADVKMRAEVIMNEKNLQPNIYDKKRKKNTKKSNREI